LSEDRTTIRRVCIGIFFIALSTLMLEVVLTRIFSVTMWYHFAFMAVSLAMFGLAAGGAINYALADKIDPQKIRHYLSLGSLLLAWAIPGAYLWHLGVPLFFRMSFPGLVNLFFAYLGLAVPFVLSGFVISLALARYPLNVGRIYFSDLVGAGLGCMIVVVSMHLMASHQVVLLISLLALLGAAAFKPAGVKATKLAATAVVVVIAMGLNAKWALLEPDFVKGGLQSGAEFSKWNSFSRVTVFRVGEPGVPLTPFGWGMSDRCPHMEPGRKLSYIDSPAATPIIQFDGDLSKHKYLAWDVTNIVHFIKQNADVLVIGIGGGRDILSAMYFKQNSVTGVEINPIFREISLGPYAEYSGALYSEDRPDVRVVIDEGRSFLQRSGDQFDIVQMSLVDTWAATAAGAFTLTENNLYTVEAFSDVFQRLKPGGIYSVSRFAYDPPRQTLRVVSLTRQMFEELGAPDFEDSIAIIINEEMGGGPYGTASVMIKNGRFTESEIQALEQVCELTGFELIYMPGRNNPPSEFVKLIETDDFQGFLDAYIYDITPPHDDSPFFFHMVKTRDILRSGFGILYKPYAQGQQFNYKAVFVLFGLLLVSAVLCLLFVFVPLWIKSREDSGPAEHKAGYLAYFTCLGLGFMLVEIPLLQRFILLLGHPIYSLTVILFSLLVFSGIGSGLTTRMNNNPLRALKLVLVGVAVLLPVYIWFLPEMIYAIISWSTLTKVLIAVLSLLPIGLLLGMPFPLGITIMSRRSAPLIPWVWGVNGAGGVLASVLAVVIALLTDFTSALTVGLACYCAALLVSLSFPARQANPDN